MLQLQESSSDKQPLWLVERSYSLGAAHNQDIQAGSIPEAAQLNVDGDEVHIIPLSQQSVEVNGAFIEQLCRLVPGDKIVIGFSEFILLDPKADLQQSKADNLIDVPLYSFISQTDESEVWPLSAHTLIGRGSDCDILIHSTKLSRHHAELTCTENHIEIKDLQSVNGTKVNGNVIAEMALEIGDVVSFAGYEFILIRRSNDVDLQKTTLRPAVKVAPVTKHRKKDALPQGQQHNSQKRVSKKTDDNKEDVQLQGGIENKNNSVMLICLGLLAVLIMTVGFFALT